MKQFARVLLFVSSCLVAIAGLPVDEQSQPDYDIDTATVDTPVIYCDYKTDQLRRRREITSNGSTDSCYFRGDGITVRCMVSSKKTFGSFIRRRLDLNASEWTTESGNDVTVTTQTQGYYQCLVNTSAGVVMSEVKVVRQAEIKVEKNKIIQLTRHRGQLAILPCLYKSVPSNVFVSWTKNNKTLSDTGPNWFKMDNGTLLIRDLNDEDKGEYRCRVHNSVTYGAYLSNTVNVTVESGWTDGAGINLLHHAPTVSAVVGESAKMICIFENRTASDHHSWTLTGIRWLRVGRGAVTSLSSLSELSINQIQLSDSGTYTCTAQYRTAAGAVQELNGSVQLNVEERANIKQPLTNQKIAVGSSAEFICEASGIPRPTITWYINAVQIQTNFGNRSEDSIRWNSTSVDNNKRTTSRLLLSRSNAQIAGSVIVSCNASNVHGYQVRNAYAAWVSSLSVSDDVSVTSSSTTSVRPRRISSSRSTTTKISTSTTTTTTTASDQRSSSLTRFGFEDKDTPDYTTRQLTQDTSTSYVPLTSSLGPSEQNRMLIYVYITVGGILVLVAVLTVIILVCFLRHRRRNAKKKSTVKEEIATKKAPPTEMRLKRSGSTDSGISTDNINMTAELEESKHQLNAIEETQSDDDDEV